MIAVSDAVLIVVSVAVLSAGLYRWQDKVEQASLARQTPTVPQQTSQNSNAVVSDTQIGSIDDSTGGAISVSNAASNVQSTTEGSIERDITQGTTNQPGQEPLEAENGTALSNSDNSDGAETRFDSTTDAALASATYMVEEGDSLSRIANRFNTSVSTLQQINDLQGTLIRVGQTLRYPLPAN